jgi:hypothetical protein
MNTIYTFYKKLEKDTFSFIYQGLFNDDSIVEVLRLNDYNIDYVSDLTKLKGRISFLIAECFQNIALHGDKPDIVNNTNNKPSMFMTRNIGDSYYIGSSNLIENKKVASLNSQLENINTLNKEELALLHRELLSHNDYTTKGGVGLGLIEMARKSGHRLSYQFEFVNYYLSQFYVQLNLQTRSAGPEFDIPLNETVSLHQLMNANNVMMVHKGDFNQESILPLLRMLENNFNKPSSSLTSNKKVFYMVVELLQNVSKYALIINGIKHGIVLICRKGQQFCISTGNFIRNDRISIVKEHLDMIAGLTKDELAEMHKRKLIEGAQINRQNGGLGLIDVARYSTEKINYEFHPIDDELSFYTLQVTI